jgi:hypothetical protein
MPKNNLATLLFYSKESYAQIIPLYVLNGLFMLQMYELMAQTVYVSIAYIRINGHIKGIVQPFKLGGETRLIRSAVK